MSQTGSEHVHADGTDGLILVVDDEAPIIHIVTKRLESRGFTVVSASNGQDALALARQHVPRLVVTDWHMPRMTGLELCHQLAEAQETDRIPVILLTSGSFQVSDDKIAGTNVRSVLGKPFSARKLSDLIERTLTDEAGQNLRKAA